MKKIFSIAGLFIIITISCFAQKNETGGIVLVDPTLNEIQNRFVDNQAEALLSQASEVLADYPPDWPEPAARKSALLLLDGVLHDVYAPQRPPVQEFYKSRMIKAIEEIEQTEIASGARIWKLYDHGFVIRSKSVTIGFDLIRGKSARAEEWVAQSFIDQGKPVVAPPDIWKDKSINKSITHLERVAHTIQTLPVQSGKQILKVVAYPGHQAENIENNVSLVITPEGLSFSHMGDQSNSNDFRWIDEVANNHVVDVLLPNCWTSDIVRVAKGFSPALIITGHENEMGHTIDHREPYWLTYQRREGSDRFGGTKGLAYDTPLILMTWGESYEYNRENF